DAAMQGEGRHGPSRYRSGGSASKRARARVRSPERPDTGPGDQRGLAGLHLGGTGRPGPGRAGGAGFHGVAGERGARLGAELAATATAAGLGSAGGGLGAARTSGGAARAAALVERDADLLAHAAGELAQRAQRHLVGQRNT